MDHATKIRCVAALMISGLLGSVTLYMHLGVGISVQQVYVAESDVDMCNVKCSTGVPCSYHDELDLRIIVITFNRPKSLRLCLDHIANIDTCTDQVGVDIWIDRKADGAVDNETLAVARSFSTSWTMGRVCVHMQPKSASIGGQWIDTWRPKPNTRELCLILEDDIDISPQAYRWLKTVRQHFEHRPDVAGYGLQMENVKTVQGKPRPMKAPQSDLVFLYAQFTTWGFAPDATFWRQFQDWYHEQKQDPDFRPYVPNIISTVWYKNFLRHHKENTMWSMWFTYFCYIHGKLTVLSNLCAYTGRKDVFLDVNRMEAGLHFRGGRKMNVNERLLKTWNQSYERFPTSVKRYRFDGTLIAP